MNRSLCVSLFKTMLLFLFVTSIPFCLAERTISKEYQIFNNVNRSIFTIINGASHGSGFLYSKEGLIITNRHVVYPNIDSKIIVRIDGQNIIGEVIDSNPKIDIAVIKIEPGFIAHLNPLKLFLPTTEPLVMRGEEVLTVGSPVDWKKLENTLTRGIVSNSDENIIFHDASINGGNSGGPLLNFNGEVIGVNTFLKEDRGQPLGGAINSKIISDFVSHIPKELILKKISTERLPIYPLKILPMGIIYESHSEQFVSKVLQMNFDKFIITLSTAPDEFKTVLDFEKLANQNQSNRLRRSATADGQSDSVSVQDDNVYNNDFRDLIKITIQPKVVLTTGTKLLIGLSALGGVTPSQSDYRFQYEGDFSHFNIVNVNGEKICLPYIFGKNERHQVGTNMIDKTYVGYYEYDFSCFKQDNLYFALTDMQGKSESHLLKSGILSHIREVDSLLSSYRVGNK